MDSTIPNGAIEPIGVVSSPRKKRRDDEWGTVESTITLDAEQFDPVALNGLSTFSHAEVIFFMDRVREEEIEWKARHPRNNSDWPSVGIFAQRAKSRPNRIGLSRCQITSVDGLTVSITGLDAIDGTPILGLKPYMNEFGPNGPVRQPAWADELMANYY
ncbi:SAM-dependent methyltransferase [Halocatena halophila]|uniref:SAM-dependent methyltransferase n=1 Tax=Halocatena halophila TaxID=2814576 RepID=UPI002ED1F7D8